MDNVATFIHIQCLNLQKYALGRPVVFTRSLVFAVAFMCLFSTIIALSKDIEDVDGDREHGIQSLAVILGKEKVLGHCVLASTLCLRAWSVDLDNKASISSFYMLIWKASDRITSGQVKIFIDLVKLSTN
ncbi:hypothetical protein RHGRI_004107 [Rhododendron griersonianum]|uniref:Uncharacterized protein n=1 Tax=Rhododendron griersonianum TaxID=479676 RepID=A0AAV6L7C4_9ERIC|nr:hypothetical protein RHGRI_004107 [Rhododendron griersonianum]